MPREDPHPEATTDCAGRSAPCRLAANESVRVCWLDVPGAAGKAGAFVTERHGGCSRGPFTSLNLGYHVGDESACVARNRELASLRAGVAPDSWVLGRQCHGAGVAVVAQPDRGRGATAHDDALPAVDALVTHTNGLTLVVLVADCVPVFLVDPRRPAIGLAHAGWRGTVGHVARRTVEAMQAAFGSTPEGMGALIGPSVGPDHYRVGPEVAAAFRASYARSWQEILCTRADGSIWADLWRANATDLADAGILPERIAIHGTSTAGATDRFFSHRAEGATGRFAGGLFLP